jgi:hypothetical protein
MLSSKKKRILNEIQPIGGHVRPLDGRIPVLGLVDVGLLRVDLHLEDGESRARYRSSSGFVARGSWLVARGDV